MPEPPSRAVLDATSAIVDTWWRLSAPIPQQSGNLSPGIPGQSADDPPFSAARIPLAVQVANIPPPAMPTQRPVFAPIPVPATTSDNPPFSQRKLDAHPLMLWHLPAVPMPQPPQQWAQAPPTIVGDEVLTDQRAIVAQSIAPWWHISPPFPILQGRMSPGIPGQSADIPLMDTRAIVAGSVLPWHHLPAPAPFQAQKLPVAITDVPVNDPPFGQHTRMVLANVCLAWETTAERAYDCIRRLQSTVVASITPLSPIRIDRGSGTLQVANHGTGVIQHTTNLGSGIMALTQLRQKIEDFVCGDALAVERTIAGIPTGLTLTTARFTIKAVATNLDAAATLQLTITSALTSSGQITNTGSSGTGAVRFTLSGAQTVLLTPEREYAFDIQVNTSDGAPYTPCKGKMKGEREITITS